MSESENRRKTFANQIERCNRFLESNDFSECRTTELKERLDMVKTAFAHFSEEHLKLVQWVASETFKEHDIYFASIESTYQSAVMKFNRRINELETQDVIQRHEPTQRNEQHHDVPIEEENAHNRNSRIQSVVVPIGEMHDLRERLMSRTNTNTHTNSHTNSRRVTCYSCGEYHPLNKCPYFLRHSINSRIARIRELGLCENCLVPTNRHDQHRCSRRHTKPCRCGRWHNTLLCHRTHYKYSSRGE